VLLVPPVLRIPVLLECWFRQPLSIPLNFLCYAVARSGFALESLNVRPVGRGEKRVRS